MKPMIYYPERLEPVEVLYLGKYKKYDFFVLNLGTHPTAYIRIPKTHPFFGKSYEECSPNEPIIEPLTFSDSSAIFKDSLNQKVPDGWYLGIDFAHMGDWLGYWSEEENIKWGNHKYTTAEIAWKCTEIIDYLIQVQNHGTA